MKFRYKKTPDNTYPSGFMSLPIIPVRLFNGNKSKDVRCLLDSGSDHSMFHTSIADVLGIDWARGEPRTYYGIAEQATIGFLHPIQLQVEGFNEVIDIDAAFTEDNDISLIGQVGFFDYYQVIFERYRGRFEVKSRTHLYR
jgi:hypothetical protein